MSRIANSPSSYSLPEEAEGGRRGGGGAAVSNRNNPHLLARTLEAGWLKLAYPPFPLLTPCINFLSAEPSLVCTVDNASSFLPSSLSSYLRKLSAP